MPTLFLEQGFRFFFYSNEGHEPCHVHVVGHGGEAKLWVPMGEVAWCYRFNAHDLRTVVVMVRRRAKEIEERWNEHFRSCT